MSKKRLELLLLIIIGLETVAAAVLIAWAVFIRSDASDNTQTTTKTGTATAPLKAPAIQTQAFAEGLTRPTSIASSDDPADTRLFVTEGKGIIRTVDAGGTVSATPLLDISGKVKDQGEMGLLGLALHPGFKNNGYFYVNYVDTDQNTIISRFKVSSKTGLGDPASEQVLIKLKQPYTNHNGGALAFGPDGYLYAALGDGGSGGDPENRAQNKGELFGKILRLDVNHGNPYAIPAGNPFKGTADVKEEIWAYGLRNPWRISFDRKTGDLYIADVGQKNYEEVNVQAAASKGGQNYGWRCYEGLHEYNTSGCQPASAYVAPILEYDHSEERCSITGGYVYRGSAYPAMQGKYFYADYCSGQLYYAAQAGDAWQPTLAASTALRISTFGENSAGELFAADVQTGKLFRIIDTNASQR